MIKKMRIMKKENNSKRRYLLRDNFRILALTRLKPVKKNKRIDGDF